MGLIARIGASLYFANAAYVKDMILAYLADLNEVNKVEYVILEMTPVVSVDSSALHMLHDLKHTFQSSGLELAFCMVGSRPMKTMELGGLKEQVGRQWFFKTVDEAVHYCVKHRQVIRHKEERIAQGISQPVLPSADGIVVKPGNEVGFSNDLREDQTVVYISLAQDIPGALNLFSGIFAQHKVTVVRANIEPNKDGGSKHTYNVVSEKSKGKLKDWEVGLVKESIVYVWEEDTTQKATRARSLISQIPADDLEIGVATKVEDMLKAQDAKIDNLTSIIRALANHSPPDRDSLVKM